MNICLVSPEPLYPLSGGGTIGTLKIVQRMVKVGHKIHVITPLHVDKKTVEKKFDVKIHPFNPFIIRKGENLYIRRLKNLVWAFLSFYKINKVVKEQNIDLIFARNFIAGIGSSITKLFQRIPYVVSVTDITSGYFYDQYKLPRKFIDFLVKIEVKTMRNADKIFVITNEMKKIFTKHGIKEEKVKVVYDGADEKRFNPHIKSNLKRKLGLGKDKIIFFHGTMEPHMGIYHLISSVGKLKGNIKLVLLGGGTLLDNIKKYTEERKINNVIFLGRVDYEKVPEYISIADICIVPYPPNFSANLILTLKLLEYAAMGKPIICSKLKGIGEVFKENKDLIFYDSQKKDELAKKIIFLLKNKKLAKKLGKNARKIIEQKLNWKNVIDNLIAELNTY